MFTLAVIVAVWILVAAVLNTAFDMASEDSTWLALLWPIFGIAGIVFMSAIVLTTFAADLWIQRPFRSEAADATGQPNNA